MPYPKKYKAPGKIRSVRIPDELFNQIIANYGTFTEWIDKKLKSDRKISIRKEKAE